MYLATAETVLATAQMTSSAERLAAVMAALETTSDLLEKALGTTFARQEVTDVFSMVLRPYQTFPEHRLRLSGLVNIDTDNLEVRTATTPILAEGQGDLLDPSYYVYDSTAGLLRLFTDRLVSGNRCLSVSYCHGLSRNGQKQYLQVPSWLEQAAVLVAMDLCYKTQWSFVNNKDARVRFAETHRYIEKLVREHCRPAIGCYSPTVTLNDC